MFSKPLLYLGKVFVSPKFSRRKHLWDRMPRAVEILHMQSEVLRSTSHYQSFMKNTQLLALRNQFSTFFHQFGSDLPEKFQQFQKNRDFEKTTFCFCLKPSLIVSYDTGLSKNVPITFFRQNSTFVKRFFAMARYSAKCGGFESLENFSQSEILKKTRKIFA